MKRAKRTIKRTAPPPFQSARFLSPDEKRQLILAHAEMRHTHDPVQLASLWAGVLMAVVVVAVGWWWSVGPSIFAGSGESLSASIVQMKEDATSLQTLIDQTNEQIQVKEQESAALEAMADTLNSTSTE